MHACLQSCRMRAGSLFFQAGRRYKRIVQQTRDHQMADRQKVTIPAPLRAASSLSSWGQPRPPLAAYYKQPWMLQPTEESQVKIDALISGIRMINLHVFNFLCEQSSQRARGAGREAGEEFRKLSTAHFQEHMKFISEYLRKCLRDMAKTRVSLSPLVFRPLRPRLLADEDFLRFENHNYGVKFVFNELLKEVLMNIEIYRKTGGTRIAGVAMRKLEMTFLNDISSRFPEGQFTADALEAEGKAILEEVTMVFSGEKCANCGKHLVLNNEVMAFLPPTVRESSEPREGRNPKKYYHESCL